MNSSIMQILATETSWTSQMDSPLTNCRWSPIFHHASPMDLPGAGGRRSREVARCRWVGAETAVGEKEAKAGSPKDLEAGQRMIEKRSLSAEVAIEAKKPRKKTGQGVRARLKVRILRSLAVRAESLTETSLQRKRMGRRFALKVKRRRRRKRRSKEKE